MGCNLKDPATVLGNIKVMTPTHVYMRLPLAFPQFTGRKRTMRGEIEQIFQEPSTVINKNYPVQKDPLHATLLPPYATTNQLES